MDECFLLPLFFAFVQSLFSFPKNNLTKKNIIASSHGLFTMSDYKTLDINIEACMKLPEVTWHQKGIIGCKLLGWPGVKRSFV